MDNRREESGSDNFFPRDRRKPQQAMRHFQRCSGLRMVRRAEIRAPPALLAARVETSRRRLRKL